MGGDDGEKVLFPAAVARVGDVGAAVARCHAVPPGTWARRCGPAAISLRPPVVVPESPMAWDLAWSFRPAEDAKRCRTYSRDTASLGSPAIRHRRQA
jgi:hypothetical protein